MLCYNGNERGVGVMLKTYVRPSRDLRNSYSKIAKIVKQHDHVIITNNGRGESVLIGIDDYAQYEEFLHSRYIAEELEKAKAQAIGSNIQWKNHDELWKEIRSEHGL
jgi:prevent-host-death family protein